MPRQESTLETEHFYCWTFDSAAPADQNYLHGVTIIEKTTTEKNIFLWRYKQTAVFSENWQTVSSLLKCESFDERSALFVIFIFWKMKNLFLYRLLTVEIFHGDL